VRPLAARSDGRVGLWKPWSVTVDDRPSRVLDAVDDSAPKLVMFLADLVRMRRVGGTPSRTAL
jgi:hypothetical protein